MKYSILIKILYLVIVAGACRSTYNVIQLTPDSQPEKTEGFFYALPRTFVNIEITITKTDHFKGPYAEYAERYLGMSNVETSNTTKYEISDVTFKTFSEPDPEQFYFVQICHKKLKKDNIINLGLTEAGLIQSVNEFSEGIDSEKIILTPDDYFADNSKTFFFSGSNVYEKVDTIIEHVTVDTLVFERQTFKRTLVEKPTEQKAREAADFILKIRENRFNMITGFQEVAYEKATMQFMYESLENLEQEYLKLFTGISTTSMLRYRYTYLPQGNVFRFSMPLFKFSTKHGIVKDDHPFGEMVYLNVERGQNTILLESYTRKIKELNRKNNGFYYRIPEYARFVLKQGITTKAEATFLINQFGVVHSLPTGKSKLKFYPNSGALKSASSLNQNKKK